MNISLDGLPDDLEKVRSAFEYFGDIHYSGHSAAKHREVFF